MLSILRATRFTNPPILDDEYLRPELLEAQEATAARRRASAFSAAVDVRKSQRNVERVGMGHILQAFNSLEAHLQRALITAAAPGHLQIRPLMAHVDRLLDDTKRAIETAAHSAYREAADLGTSHVAEAVKAAGFRVREATDPSRVFDVALAFPWKGDPALANLAYDNTVDLLSDVMTQFRARIATSVRHIATAQNSFAEQMIKLANDLRAAGFDNAEFRSERVFRTELGRTFNTSTFSSIADVGGRVPGVLKIWIRTHDHRTRDTHVQAGDDYGRGNGIAPDARFQVGSARLRYPIDPQPEGTNTARETIMCRCNTAVDFDSKILAAA